MRPLTWSDLFIGDPEDVDVWELLSLWPHVTGQLKPIGASVFGDLYFERADGRVERLDVFDGEIQFVADSVQDFAACMNSQQWQHDNLFTEGVMLLMERGIVRGPGQLFLFTPHPGLAGKFDWDTVKPVSARVLHMIHAQIGPLQGQAANDGSENGQ